MASRSNATSNMGRLSATCSTCLAPEISQARDRYSLIFIDGGAFVTGDKHSTGSPLYDNIALWAARHGFIGVTLIYRLAPQSPWPAGAEDIALAVNWVADNIGSRGGDGSRVYLLGHSAGPAHAQAMSRIPNFTRLRQRRRDQRRHHAFRPLRPHRQARCAIPRRPISVTIARAMRNAPRLRVWSLPKFRHGRHGRARPTGIFTTIRSPEGGGVRRPKWMHPHPLVVLPRHNHMSEVYSINTAEKSGSRTRFWIS